MSGDADVLFGERPRMRNHAEDALQRDVVQFLRFALPADATYYHVPNGGQRHSKAAARMVGLGVRAGVPDLHILWAGRSIYIELKTARGALSEHQRQFHVKLRYCGAEVLVCRSVECVAESLTELGVPLRARLA